MTEPTIFASLDSLRNHIGREVAISDWMIIDQSRIQQFAEVTNDRQWIHLDVERCRQESPYKAPIAHGFLLLSLLPAMLESALRINGLAITINYGLERVRFPAAVLAGQRVRGRLTLSMFEQAAGGVQVKWTVTVDVENGDKPVCVAEMLARYYPEQKAA